MPPKSDKRPLYERLLSVFPLDLYRRYIGDKYDFLDSSDPSDYLRWEVGDGAIYFPAMNPRAILSMESKFDRQWSQFFYKKAGGRKNIKRRVAIPPGVPFEYIINLDSRPDRGVKAVQLLSDVSTTGDDPTGYMFPAVIGKLLTPEELRFFKTHARTESGKMGRAGCYLSHLGAIACALLQQTFPLVVLEDDIAYNRVHYRAGVSITKVIESAPKDKTILYLGALPVRDRKRVPLKHDGWDMPTGIAFYGGHAYVIPTPVAAIRILKWLLDHPETLDSAYVAYQKKFPELVSVLHPFLFYQTEDYSDIEGTVRKVRGSGRKTTLPEGRLISHHYITHGHSPSFSDPDEH
jgi:hypothetical protein